MWSKRLSKIAASFSSLVCSFSHSNQVKMVRSSKVSSKILAKKTAVFALIFGCTSLLVISSVISRLCMDMAFPNFWLPSSVPTSNVARKQSDRAHSFLLVFMGHSGSTAIMTALKQHSGTFISGLEPVDHGMATPEALEFADAFFNQTSSQGKTGGFKIRPRHLLAATEKWARLIQKHNIRLIRNFRGNIVKQAISHYPIVHFNSTEAYEGLKVDRRENDDTRHSPTVASFSVQIPELYQLLQKRIAGEGQVLRAMSNLKSFQDSYIPPVLKVSYEELLLDEQGTINKVQRFLGLNMNEQHLPLRVKATNDNLCELVTNYGDVCKSFVGCSDMQWMLSSGDCNCTKYERSAFSVCPDLSALQRRI
eukprot:Plantae.Rhodophyta-Palmaria_palmata.ctg18.p1 GENE.Plantae.Rhodophyta-Palmaria_palmata.ctg18~~Plantae.Rhodophyta-Palmaria_palmata.ctg18.p1  ORF type:complete len:365 (-),score=23.04 Plantae.Rhodophyta-Palmaria_palmata.ctg18:489-1583(-)